jgi:hypothetical protein
MNYDIYARAILAVTMDAVSLSNDVKPEKLAIQSIWKRIGNSPIKYEVRESKNSTSLFSIWMEWYDYVLDGLSPWGLPPDIADKLEMRIALGDGRGEGGRDFWGRPANEVNAEIKSWVDAARAEVADSEPESRPEEVPAVEAQTPGALRFGGDHNEPVGLRPLVPGQDWSLDPASRKRHAEAKRLAEKLRQMCADSHATSNALAGFRSDLELLIDSFGGTLEDLDPDLQIPRGDGIREILKQDGEQKAERAAAIAVGKPYDDHGKPPPLPDDVALEALKFVRAYNQFVALDTELDRRDQILLGPDARRTLVPPADGQAVISGAVKTGVAKLEVLVATDAEAKVAPAKPDAENRPSRRYSESQKNFYRELVSRAVSYATTSGKAAAGLYAAAVFVWNKQHWFVDLFADNPTMTNVLGWLLEALEKLPLT